MKDFLVGSIRQPGLQRHMVVITKAMEGTPKFGGRKVGNFRKIGICKRTCNL